MRIAILLASAIILTACNTSGPVPNFYQGHYYLSGDAYCPGFRKVGPNKVDCVNAKGELTGVSRYAMTSQQLQMYQFEVMQRQQRSQQMQQSIDYNNAVMSANTQATLNRASGYRAPVAQPMQMNGGNQVRCIGVGIYANCRW